MPAPPVYPPTPPPGLGYGGATYGVQPYGSGAFPRQPIPVTGGYGGQQYGYNSYGSLDITPPRVSGALSLNGFQIEVYFSEEMRDNAALTNPASYTLASILGAPASVILVTPGTPGSLGGYTSVIVTHTGTTLGGRYTVTVSSALEDMAGNPLNLPPPANQATFYTLGDLPTYQVTATAGDTLLFQFRDSLGRPQGMLTEAEFSPGIEDPASYGITTTYPINLNIEDITQVPTSLSQVVMTVSAMTSATYSVLVSPAVAYNYQGLVLPNLDPTFNGVEIGTGSSLAGALGLRLTKSAGSFYGWDFEDTSGRVLPSSSYRLNVRFDASAAVFSPPLYDAQVGWVSFSDGAVQVDVVIRRVGGADVLEVVSGAFFAQLPSAWSTGETQLSLLRNQKADSYSLLVNGTPILAVPTASFTGVPTINPGTRFILGTAYQVTQFPISRVMVTSTQTVFTSTWNFLHGVAGSFTGSSALANDRILTKRGPLVKGWGDATPATVEDVEVRLDGNPITVKAVNPYTGTIFPQTPIPRTPLGTHTIDIDYKWFPAPAMPLVGLNIPGLVLNKWDLPKGHTYPPNSPLPSSSTGAIDPSRFPMGVVLAPMERPQPVQIGHRYIGYERDYSALLNSPTTLLLNQDPHRVSKPELESSCPTANVTFDGETSPQDAETPWLLEGTDSGGLVGDGTYLVVDASEGTYATGTAAVYYRELNLACPGTVRLAGRLRVDDFTADGVFTGVGFGFHDNFRLYLMGLLSVNDLRHIGLLKDATQPQVVESWEVGPQASVNIVDEITMTLDLAALPSFVGDGSKFQILNGPQAGSYTIATCGIDTHDGTVTVTLDPSLGVFPADPNLDGNNVATVLFDVPWDENLTTFQMVADTTVENRLLQVFLGGTLVDEAVSLTGEAVAVYPADTSLLIPTGDLGRVLWGSVSRPAANSTYWSLYRYAYTPHEAVSTIRGIVVAAEMSDPPESDANNPWFFTDRFGYSEIDATGDTLLLKSTSGSDTIDLSFGYARLEPALNSRVWADVDATFKVESGVLGAGDASIRIRDDIREVLLTNLLYLEGGGSPDDPYRRLISMSQKSLSGLMTPTQEGWATDPVTTLDEPTVRGQQFTLTVQAGQGGGWYTFLDPNDNDSLSKLAEARLAVTSYTPDGVTGKIGPLWHFRVGSGATRRAIYATLAANPPRLALGDNTGTELAAFPFDWTDGEFHTYRLIASLTSFSVVAVIDDVVQGSVSLGLFPAVVTNNRRVGIGAALSNGSSTSIWESFSVSMLPPVGAKRTLGVWKGGDKDDIDNYQIPRTDGTSALNSDALAIPYVMDWRSFMQVRVHLDQSWGVSIYRPDLPPPPWYTGNFATEITDPTAAWINVEYRRLPRQYDQVASIAFGALDPRSVTQQRWYEVRYRLYNTPSEEYIQPQGMVLNRYNVIASGELIYDITPEVVTVTSLTSMLLSIRSAHMNADRVFNVIVDNVVLPSSAWTFNADTQTIILLNPLPANEYPVTVTFAPGKPVTNTYLCSQPFEGSVTKLNEGTPPYPKSQTADATREVVFGSKINDPNDLLNIDPDFILNDPFKSVEWSDPENALYDSLEFCEVDNGGAYGMLSIACDGPAPEHGLIALELSGTRFRDAYTPLPGGPGGTWGNQSAVIGGTASQFDQTFTVLASGGSMVTGGVLGGGEPLSARRLPVMMPTYPGPDAASSGAYGTGMGANEETKFRLVVVEPYEEILDIAGTVSDNTPPSFADPSVDPNPDGTPGVQLHGAAAAEMVEYVGDAAKDRLGPWGGLSSLASSLLGGGAFLTGNEVTLNGGAQVPGPTTTTFQIEAAN